MGLFFWPLMIASVILAVIALVVKKPILLIISCLFIVPLSLYLAATPLFNGWGLIFPFFYLGAAFFLRKKWGWLSALIISPNIILIAWIGYSVLNQ